MSHYVTSSLLLYIIIQLNHLFWLFTVFSVFINTDTRRLILIYILTSVGIWANYNFFYSRDLSDMFTCTNSIKLPVANIHQFQTGNLWEGGGKNSNVTEDFSMLI